MGGCDDACSWLQHQGGGVLSSDDSFRGVRAVKLDAGDPALELVGVGRILEHILRRGG